MPDRWFSAEGFGTGAVYGYTRFLLDFLRQQQPTTVAACFDESLGSCFRNQIYADYKSSRVLPDEALAFQLNACKEVTELLGIRCFVSDQYEADDLLGSLMSLLHRSEMIESVALLTRDKDLGQLLLRTQDFLWDYDAKGESGFWGERLDRTQIYQKFGVWPEQLIDYLALVGDSVDDIPGVPGVGAKTAQALLQHAHSVEELFNQLEELPKLPIRGSKRLPEKLNSCRDQIAISQRLATIVTDIELDVTWQCLQRQPPNREGLQQFCQRMGFPSTVLAPLTKMAES